jgi:hypothetical protein
MRTPRGEYIESGREPFGFHGPSPQHCDEPDIDFAHFRPSFTRWMRTFVALRDDRSGLALAPLRQQTGNRHNSRDQEQHQDKSQKVMLFVSASAFWRTLMAISVTSAVCDWQSTLSPSTGSMLPVPSRRSSALRNPIRRFEERRELGFDEPDLAFAKIRAQKRLSDSCAGLSAAPASEHSRVFATEVVPRSG